MATYEADDYADIALRLKELEVEKRTVELASELASSIAPYINKTIGDFVPLYTVDWTGYWELMANRVAGYCPDLYMPYSSVAPSRSEYFTDWTEEEIEEYTRSIPTSFWPLAVDAYAEQEKLYKDTETND